MKGAIFQLALICGNFCFATVAPEFEYRGRIPGSVLDLKNAEPFVIDLTNRLSVLEQREPPAVTGIVRKVNGQSPDTNGWVNVDVGVLTINNTPPDTNGNVNVEVGDSQSYTNAMFRLKLDATMTEPQCVYYIDTGDSSEYSIKRPRAGIEGISESFSIVLNVRQQIEVKFDGFDEQFLLIPKDWTGTLAAGRYELIFAEYAEDKFMMQVNVYRLYRQQSEFGGLKLTAEVANSSVKIKRLGGAPMISLQYSKDGLVWSDYAVNTEIQLANAGDYVCFRAAAGGNLRMGGGRSALNCFVMTGRIAASGNVNSLLDADYESVTSLEGREYCYSGLFRGCGALTTAPELPADRMATECYFRMFSECSNLVSVSSLPAVNLAKGCYHGMFDGCLHLNSIIELPASVLVDECYVAMFSSCMSLQEIKLGYVGIFNDLYFTDWVANVSPVGTLHYKGTDRTEGASAIPSGWTVISD